MSSIQFWHFLYDLQLDNRTCMHRYMCTVGAKQHCSRMLPIWTQTWQPHSAGKLWKITLSRHFQGMWLVGGGRVVYKWGWGQLSQRFIFEWKMEMKWPKVLLMYINLQLFTTSVSSHYKVWKLRKCWEFCILWQISVNHLKVKKKIFQRSLEQGPKLLSTNKNNKAMSIVCSYLALLSQFLERAFPTVFGGMKITWPIDHHRGQPVINDVYV